MKKFVLVIVAVVLLGGFAVAGEDEWDGFYVGVQAGYVMGGADLFSYDEGEVGYAIDDLNPSGFGGGLYLGYDWPLDNGVILGIMGEYNFVSADDTVSFADGYWGADFDQDWDAMLGFKAGTVIGDYQPYFTFGLASAGVKSVGWRADEVNGVEDIQDLTMSGWTIGLGIEKKMTDMLRLRAQYRYTDYGDKSWDITDEDTDYYEGKAYYDASMLTVGLTFQF